MPIQKYHNHGILLGLFFLFKLVSAQQLPPETPQPPPTPTTPSYNFSPAMATAVIVLIIFFFSIGFISVYIRHFMVCMGIGPGRNNGGGIDGWRSRRLPRGLDLAVINDFPTFLYSDVKTHRIGKSSLECAICLNEFSEFEMLRMLPPCSHVFHPHCIGTWLANHVTCPICRANLEINDSFRSLSFNYLANNNNRFEQSSDEDDCPNPSDQHHRSDVIIRVGEYPEDNRTILSPGVQDMKTVDGFIGKLPRSHSTGHSLVDDCERYTLRLTDEVRNKLVNVNLSGLPAAIISPRVGYRARSVGGVNTEDRKPDHWRFSVSPPFISRSNSTRSQKSEGVTENNNSNNSEGITSCPKNLFKSIKSPLNRVAQSDEIGERSTNRLWVNRTTQDLELEAQWKQDQ